uniref:Gastrin/cholecystokinin peptide hormone domain-containing protein n=1 Tax=Anolis carolinensis TaxID=28377 RepID=A0A803TJC7_ANOCA
MYTKLFVTLLLVALIGTSLSRSVSTSYQLDDELSMKAKAVVPGLDRMQRRSSGELVRRSWSGPLSMDQKHLISQFLPHLYAEELTGKESNAQDFNSHFPTWIDFGRRSLEDSGVDA